MTLFCNLFIEQPSYQQANAKSTHQRAMAGYFSQLG